MVSFLCALPQAAQAQSSPPHIFSGAVLVDGQTAADGTIITARVNGSIKGNATVSGGRYILAVDQGTGGTVSFTVGGLIADQTSAWEFGGAANLTLTANSNSRKVQPLMADLILQGTLDRVFWFDNQTKECVGISPTPLWSHSTTWTPFPSGSPVWVRVTGPTTATIGGCSHTFTCTNGNCWSLITVD